MKCGTTLYFEGAHHPAERTSKSQTPRRPLRRAFNLVLFQLLTIGPAALEVTGLIDFVIQRTAEGKAIVEQGIDSLAISSMEGGEILLQISGVISLRHGVEVGSTCE